MRKFVGLILVLGFVASAYAQIKPWNEMSFSEIEQTMEMAFKLDGLPVQSVRLSREKQGVNFYIDSGRAKVSYVNPKLYSTSVTYIFKVCSVVGEITSQTSWKSDIVFFRARDANRAWVLTSVCRQFLKYLKQGEATKAGNYLFENYHEIPSR